MKISSFSLTISHFDASGFSQKVELTNHLKDGWEAFHSETKKHFSKADFKASSQTKISTKLLMKKAIDQGESSPI